MVGESQREEELVDEAVNREEHGWVRIILYMMEDIQTAM